MPLKAFDVDVLKHVVTRIVTTHRIQIDPVASIVLSARLVSVAGQVTAIVYQDPEADFTWDAAADTSASEKDLMAFAVNDGTSDAQSPLAPPTHFDFGIFVKAEGDATASALLEITYVHRCDYERSFEPIQVSTWANPNPPLGEVLDLADVPEWEEDNSFPGGDFEVEPGPDGQYSGPPVGVGGGALTLQDYIDVRNIGQTILEGDTATVGVRLSSQPQKDVVLSVTNDTSETTTAVSSLTFTTSNYNTFQDVVITAVNDSAVENLEHAPVTVQVSSGDNVLYTPTLTQSRDIGIHVVDTDSLSYGINVNYDTVELVEGASAFALEVNLLAPPSADVTVLVDTGGLAGRVELAAGGAYASTQSLTFTSSNWATKQAVTAQVVDDSIDNGINPENGTITFTVTASTDTNYGPLVDTYWKYLTALVYDDENNAFASGFFVLELEDRTTDGYYSIQHLVTETASAFIRLE